MMSPVIADCQDPLPPKVLDRLASMHEVHMTISPCVFLCPTYWIIIIPDTRFEVDNIGHRSTVNVIVAYDLYVTLPWSK